MYPRATSGSEANNYKFSSCSKNYIGPVLVAKSDVCFKSKSFYFITIHTLKSKTFGISNFQKKFCPKCGDVRKFFVRSFLPKVFRPKVFDFDVS